MSLERTFSIVKPDGVQKNLIGEVYRRFEQGGLKVVAARMAHLTQAQLSMLVEGIDWRRPAWTSAPSRTG